MIQRTDLLQIPFYKKSCFTGSYKGMRYRIEKSSEDEQDCFLVYAFPGPYNFDSTADDTKIKSTFPFDSEGLGAVCDWLNETYSAHLSVWEKGRIVY